MWKALSKYHNSIEILIVESYIKKYEICLIYYLCILLTYLHLLTYYDQDIKYKCVFVKIVTFYNKAKFESLVTTL